jgi:hypothetical protein
MSQITTLAEVQVNAFNMIAIELVEADETPAVIIVRWPAKASVLHSRLFPAAADTAARVFATAVVRLTQIRLGPEAARRLRTASVLLWRITIQPRTGW